MSDAALPGAEERALLRDSLRGFLSTHWPARDAVAAHANTEALKTIWRGLAAQGVATLGTDPQEGGLAEVAVVMEELGRAACPAPLADAVLANLALWPQRESGRGLRDWLRRLHDGQASVVAANAQDGSAREISLQGEQLDAHIAPIDAGAAATHVLLLAADGNTLWLADASAAQATPARALGIEGRAQIRLTRAPATAVPLPAGLAADLHLVRRLCLLARAHGAARRAFDMAVDYAKERKQFGKPIGSFQAVQHKLADGFIALEGVRLTLHHAALQRDLAHPDWRYAAQAALAFGGQALRQVSLQTHHAFGAIGYAEEHEAPRHFRRVHLDTLDMGGTPRARVELAAHLFAGTAIALPRDDLGAAGNAFRDEVRQWLATHWSGERKAAFDAQPFHDREFDPAFARDIGRTGWIGLMWPREHGGQARSPLEQIAFMEEMERAEAPRIGAAIQSTALMLFGTPEQQRRYLPEILAGEAMHGMGYSEPEAGSDLASLKTSAVRDGDGWLINGQKIWTTTWWGKYMFLAARTHREARPPHAGISMFIVPMDTPGIQVKPAATMYDGTFSNIFYDNVRVPADALLGGENDGWKVLTGALATERGLVGGGIVLKVVHAFERLCALLREPGADGRRPCDDPLVRDRIATCAAEIEVGRRLMMHCAEQAGTGATPPEAGAVSKVFSGELMERFGEMALEMLGMDAALSQGAPGAIDRGRFEQGLRHSLMWVISIGTNEIQRSLIAQRGLGLPR